jgi:hypothetical protein
MAQGARSRRLKRKGLLRGCPVVPPSSKRRRFTMQANRSANGAVTKPGDLVVDPAAGGFVVLCAPMALGRVFLGCDIAHHREDQSSA